MSKIIDFRTRQEVTHVPNDSDLWVQLYQEQYRQMDRLELLEVMVNFQTDRTTNQAKGIPLSPKRITQGICLFAQLRVSCETEAMQKLADSYIKHLIDCREGRARA